MILCSCHCVINSKTMDAWSNGFLLDVSSAFQCRSLAFKRSNCIFWGSVCKALSEFCKLIVLVNCWHNRLWWSICVSPVVTWRLQHPFNDQPCWWSLENTAVQESCMVNRTKDIISCTKFKNLLRMFTLWEQLVWVIVQNKEAGERPQVTWRSLSYIQCLSSEYWRW